jgi:hypothetical protein
VIGCGLRMSGGSECDQPCVIDEWRVSECDQSWVTDER